jgi:predicted MFS family arabinose efflux permease
MKQVITAVCPDKRADALVRILAAEAFLVLFQAYMVAPLIPSLAESLHAKVADLGLLIPAYTIPYGLSTLVYGPVSDRFGRKKLLLTLFVLLALSSLLVPLCRTVGQLIMLRIFAGLATGGIVPVSVSLIGDIFPYERRGKPIGMLFGAMAGGMTFGASLGIFFNPILGWRNEYLIAGVISLALSGWALLTHQAFPAEIEKTPVKVRKIVSDGWQLLSSNRGRRLYSYIFINGMFHSGVFSWLGYYFKTAHNLQDQQIGLALLGYGVPGMLLGVTIGRWADRHGRRRIIPFGLLLGAFSVLVLALQVPVWLAAIVVSTLSFGYDMTQPLFAGMVTMIGNEQTRGLAVGLSACILFLGYGAGAIIFQILNTGVLNLPFAVFGSFELLIGILAFRVFKHYR